MMYDCAGRSFIMLLNTRTSCNYGNGFTRPPWLDTQSQEPGPILDKLLTQPTKNQYAHPDAPKPIHPDKEHFCSSTLKLGAYIRFSVLRSDLCRNRPKQKTETRFPHKRSNANRARPSARHHTAKTKWWRWTESNRRPPACKAGALPIELHPRFL
jgi:hypothetical protein